MMAERARLGGWPGLIYMVSRWPSPKLIAHKFHAHGVPMSGTWLSRTLCQITYRSIRTLNEGQNEVSDMRGSVRILRVCFPSS